MRDYSQSAILLERAKKSMAGGVSSEFRKFNYPHALFYTHAEGSRIYDADGNEYIDYSLSQGPMIAGHSNPHVIKSVAAYTSKGQLFAGQHILEIELAEKLQKYIPSAELVRFCLDGSEAVQTALRVVRAKTGKKKFLRFEGHYHGWLDNVAWAISTPSAEALGPREKPVVFPWSAGLPYRVDEDFVTLPWNDLALIENLLTEKHQDIAAIITEPVMCNNGCIEPVADFLAGLRNLCDIYKVALIFDEVITGFRISLGGAQTYYGVTPDVSIFAKAMASGYPISAIVGKKEWMEPLVNGTVIHAGTMNAGNPTVAAALATIEVLEMEGVYERIFSLGNRLIDGLKAANKKHHQNLLVHGPGPMFHTGFINKSSVKDFRDVLEYDKVKLGKFVAGMQDAGIRLIGRGLWYISSVHTEEDIDKAISAADGVLKEMAK
jgi:glutamate-1-semialdehyde 2,1-aminomutase